jgi:hypothetical protein
MSANEQPHGTTGPEKTSCTLFNNGCRSYDTSSSGDHLCGICYETHPFVFEELLTEKPYLRAMFFQANPGETTPAYRNEHKRSCVSRRHRNRKEPWVARLIAGRISSEAAVRADARRRWPDGEFIRTEDAVLCLPPNRDHDTLCEFCGEVWEQDKSFSKDFAELGVTVTRGWEGDRAGIRKALKDINEAKVARKAKGRIES